MAGRPLRYKTVAELEAAIDAYFEQCKGHPLEVDGEPVYDKYGQPVIVDVHPPTVTGLALHLGFTSRKALLDYQGRKAFCNTITRAKARVEAYTEERLFDRDGVNGAKFSLVNNFSGWSSNPAPETSTPPANNLFTQMEASLHELSEIQPETAADAALVEDAGASGA